MRIRWGFFFTLFLIIHSSAEAIDRIRIAVSNPNMPNLTLAVAQKRGFLKDEGIEAEVIRMNRELSFLFFFLASFLWTSLAGAQERLTFLYPSPAGTWVVPMIAKEAKYFEREGLSVELVRVGGSTRIVAALMGAKIDLKPERVVDLSIVDELERSGFIDSVYK